MARLQVVKGDITQLDVDAIVNAANARLAGGGGVDGAIHRAAGDELYSACRRLGGCDTGSAKLTPGFNLLARAIIHTVGPIWRGGNEGERELLARCYKTCITIAEDNNFHSIAFPAISCGVYGFPIELAVPIAVGAVRDALSEDSSLQTVIFCCFDADILALYQQQLSHAESLCASEFPRK
ncbi:O-acetyl-ADP-ribose deacetylase [Aurantivibrio plasticivorans]